MMLRVALLSSLFVLINALFVAAEFALIGSPKATLERKAAQGNRAARRVLDVLLSPPRQDRYVATAQLGITLASLGLGMYGEHALAQILEHALSRVIQIRVVETSRIGLLLGTLVDRIDLRAPIVEKMRLNTAAKIGADLEIFVTRPEISYRQLDREE